MGCRIKVYQCAECALRQIYIEAELEVIDSTRYYPKIVRQEYTRPQFAEQRPRS